MKSLVVGRTPGVQQTRESLAFLHKPRRRAKGKVDWEHAFFQHPSSYREACRICHFTPCFSLSTSKLIHTLHSAALIARSHTHSLGHRTVLIPLSLCWSFRYFTRRFTHNYNKPPLESSAYTFNKDALNTLLPRAGNSCSPITVPRTSQV
jgi:hypothetical protein